MESFLGLVGLGVFIFLCYAGGALSQWAKYKWPSHSDGGSKC